MTEKLQKKEKGRKFVSKWSKNATRQVQTSKSFWPRFTPGEINYSLYRERKEKKD